ncbi:MAG: DUF4349 domain-containing protein [Flavobacteriaceae bacterium]|nr:DUF4349 domain-containing protein [Flavobacteriaceae bacterium]
MRTNKLNQKVKILTVLFSVGLLLSCSKDYKEQVPVEGVEVSELYESVEDAKTTVLESNEVKKEIPQKQKIIKSAHVRYKVNKVKMATGQINKMVQQFNGYISDQRFQNTIYQIENRFTIKVPEQHFDVLMDSLVKIAEFVDYENITTQDVTEEYIDLKSRLKTKLEVKQRYETILRQRAKTVKDILATEEKLRVIQEEIEASQGRLNYLTNKVSFSTIQVDLYETVDYKETPESYTRTFFSKTKEGFSFGWKLIESIVLGIIYIWPLILIGGLLFFIIKKRLRK